MKTLPADSVDAVVTDPPYGWRFMGKAWDAFDIMAMATKATGKKSRLCADGKVRPPRADCKSIAGGTYDNSLTANKSFQIFTENWAKEAIRVLKPGGHMLVFCGPRTYHRMASGVEDAGFQIRDQLQWLFGSGFPKSHNIGDGRGTALKPANEPIVLARKPLSESTVANNVLKWGAGALNIDASRIGIDKRFNPPTRKAATAAMGSFAMCEGQGNVVEGRWPANVLFDEEAAAMLDAQSGVLKSGELRGYNIPGESSNGHLKNKKTRLIETSTASCGGASRFFKVIEQTEAQTRFIYQAKTSKRERNAGLEGMPLRATDDSHIMTGLPDLRMKQEQSRIGNQNHHPTVKPVKLMEYLCKLITPLGGVVLDPFMGSGTTGIAAKNLEFSFIGIEMDADYMEIAKRRIENAIPKAG